MRLIKNAEAPRGQDATEGRLETDVSRPIVFIHSSFRTSSTWLWAKFRHESKALAYYEFFHEHLATMTPEEAKNISGSSWRSNHPSSSPYFLEFLPLLRSNGGVDGYSRAMAYDRFVPRGGLAGDIGEDEAAYILRLIDLASESDMTAVLSGVRTLGRIGGLKRRLGGFHIFLFRNLFHQWLSYCSQAEAGNPFFLQTISSTLRANEHDPFFQFLARTYLDEIGNEAAKGPIEAASGGTSGTESVAVDDERLFIAFVGLHLYTSINAAMAADLVLDVNRLTRDQVYRRQAEATIQAHTGMAIDLSDARESVEYARFDVADLPSLQRRLEAVLSKAIQSLDHQLQSERALQFGQAMLDETLDEMFRFQFYATSAAAHIQDLRTELEERTRERDRLKQKLRKTLGRRLRAPFRRMRNSLRDLGGPADRN